MKLKTCIPIICILAVCALRTAYAAPCQVEGPSLQVTMDYLVKVSNENGDNLSLSWSARSGILTYTRDSEGTMNANSLDCSELHVGNIGQEKTDIVWVGKYGCKDNWNPYETLRIVYSGDPEQAAKVKRALSHLIYLCHQEYRTKHGSNNDPF